MSGDDAVMFRDAALSNAFPHGLDGHLVAGASGPQVVAVQYALGRLGHLNALADGRLGPRTFAAVDAFRQARGLGGGAVVDAALLASLDEALAAYDGRTPASRAPDPLAYLSDFSARHISRVELGDHGPAMGWGHPEVRAAYGRFVTEYWEVLKQNRVEADCKTLALFFMDQFRALVRTNTQVELPLPRSSEGHLPQAPRWQCASARRPLGYFQRVQRLATVRPGYEAVSSIERLDPAHTMLEGLNLSAGDISADQVARAAVSIGPLGDIDNRGNHSRPEVPLAALDAGVLVFLAHGDGRWDHTVNVVDASRDPDGRVRRVRLAVGSFDDMKDTDHATAPRGPAEIDNYAEEVTIDFGADGAVTASHVTWSSEPTYEVAPRYDATNTLMDLHAGSKLKVARWG